MDEETFRNKVASYIEGRLWEDIRAEDLAKQVDMNVFTFIQKFHSAFGTTPALYIIRERGKRFE